MKTAIVPKIGQNGTLQVAEYVATISPGKTVAQYIDYLTGENACRLFRQAACGTLCPKTAERSSSRTCRSSSSSTPIIKYTHYHHVLHYLHYHHCCQGGITEYTITISAIVGNAKMKGVTTKVWSMTMIFIMIFMLSFYLIICQQLSLGVSTPLSTTKSNTSPFGLDAKQQVSP